MPKFKIFGQWMEELPSWAQKFVKPSCTIPDQSMTIAEIIAKYTRTGLVPGSVVSHADDGGNIASDPGFDPLDEWNESMAAAARAEADLPKLEDLPDDKKVDLDKEAREAGGTE